MRQSQRSKISTEEIFAQLLTVKYSRANPRKSKYIRDTLYKVFERKLMTLKEFLSDAENIKLNPLYRAAVYQLLAKNGGDKGYLHQGSLAFNLGVTKLSCWIKAQLLYKQEGDDFAVSYIEERINRLVYLPSPSQETQLRSEMHEVSLACNPSSMFYRETALIGYRHDPYGVSVISSNDTASKVSPR